MKRGHSLDVVMTLVLFCLFTGSVLMVLMLGVQSYQGVVQSMQESYEERTCLQYIATKIDHYSGIDAVQVGTFGDGSALELHQTIEDCDYITYIYSYQGKAMELFCEHDADLEPEAGFAIMDVVALDVVEVSDDLLQISCTGSGGSASIYVGLHNGEEVTG